MVLVLDHFLVFEVIKLKVFPEEVIIDMLVALDIDYSVENALVLTVNPVSFLFLADIVQALGSCPVDFHILLVYRRKLTLGDLQEFAKQLLVVPFNLTNFLLFLPLMRPDLVANDTLLQLSVLLILRNPHDSLVVQLCFVLKELLLVQLIRIKSVECLVDVLVHVLGVDLKGFPQVHGLTGDHQVRHLGRVVFGVLSRVVQQ